MHQQLESSQALTPAHLCCVRMIEFLTLPQLPSLIGCRISCVRASASSCAHILGAHSCMGRHVPIAGTPGLHAEHRGDRRDRKVRTVQHGASNCVFCQRDVHCLLAKHRGNAPDSKLIAGRTVQSNARQHGQSANVWGAYDHCGKRTFILNPKE